MADSEDAGAADMDADADDEQPGEEESLPAELLGAPIDTAVVHKISDGAAYAKALRRSFGGVGSTNATVHDSSIRGSSFSSFDIFKGSNSINNSSNSSSSNGRCAAGPAEALSTFFFIDLGRPTAITRLVTTGRAEEDAWVQLFVLELSMDALDWRPYLQDGRVRVFAGNDDAATPHASVLATPILARFARLVPSKWHNTPAMTVAVWGRDLGEPLGLAADNNRVPDTLFAASSSLASEAAAPWCARLNGPAAWQPAPRRPGRVPRGRHGLPPPPHRHPHTGQRRRRRHGR